MAFDDTKATGGQLTAAEYNNLVKTAKHVIDMDAKHSVFDSDETTPYTFKVGGLQTLVFKLAGDDSKIYGGASTTSNLRIYANSAGAYSNILFGGSGSNGMEFHVPAGDYYLFHESNTDFLKIEITAPDTTISTPDSNYNIYLAPHGTGVVKFGTYSSGATDTVDGYITIKDAAGNTRKLAVIN